MGKRVAVVGSLMMDLVVRLPRLPLVGESLVGTSFQTFVGGKGANQAIAAARLGAEHVAMVGRTGDDVFADEIFSALRSAGVDWTHVTRDPAAGTGVAVPMVFDDGRNSIAAIPRANLAMTAADIERARAVIEASDMLLLQFEVAMDAVVAAIQVAKAAAVPVLLNPAPVAPVSPGLLPLVDWLVVNEVEAAALAPAGETTPEAQAATLRAAGAGSVIVTLGSDGAVACSPEGFQRVSSFPVTAVDSVGAGDAFCGGLAVALVEGRPLAEALRFASAAGAASVTRAGAVASLPRRDEVERLLASS